MINIIYSTYKKRNKKEKKRILKEFYMSNFKHPQYLTPNGLVRTVKKPKLKSLLYAEKAKNASAAKAAAAQAPSKLRALAEKRVMAKQILQRQDKGISDEAAKMIAEALKTMLHS